MPKITKGWTDHDAPPCHVHLYTLDSFSIRFEYRNERSSAFVFTELVVEQTDNTVYSGCLVQTTKQNFVADGTTHKSAMSTTNMSTSHARVVKLVSSIKTPTYPTQVYQFLQRYKQLYFQQGFPGMQPGWPGGRASLAPCSTPLAILYFLR